MTKEEILAMEGKWDESKLISCPKCGGTKWRFEDVGCASMGAWRYYCSNCGYEEKERVLEMCYWDGGYGRVRVGEDGLLQAMTKKDFFGGSITG